MASWDRFDICEAYRVLEADYNVGGWLRERPSNQRRKESIGVQLHRIGYTPGFAAGGYRELEENALEIYLACVLRWKLPIDGAMRSIMLDIYVLEYLQVERPEVFGQPVATVNYICRTCGRKNEFCWGSCEDKRCASHAKRVPLALYADPEREAARLRIREYPNGENVASLFGDSDAFAQAVMRVVPEFNQDEWVSRTVGQFKERYC